MLVVDTPDEYQAWLKERVELAGTQVAPAPTDRPPGEPKETPMDSQGSVPPPGAPKTADPHASPNPANAANVDTKPGAQPPASPPQASPHP
jgi:hypothetical protein